jgi:hypothetical protein
LFALSRHVKLIWLEDAAVADRFDGVGGGGSGDWRLSV